MQMEIAHTSAAGQARPRVRVQATDFDLSAEVAELRAGDAGIGAVAAFVGTVRDRDGSAAQAAAPVSLLELEHYPGMTERAIEAMIDEAQRRFGIRGARVVHRIGPLALNEQIVLVAVAAAHRGEAFQACEFLMDYLKTQAPFWKKEHCADGARWVDARVADDAAAARWGLPATNLAGSVAGLPPALPAVQPA
ncbi:molybdenum cofactor biosynthesis protein MoaE [Aquincola sp. J276]|uniref:molybdenum cofactor biosynthesis protein MoaE n=1 Tax=Aquincola sp. J276 TaxID=2898432 RepID=UPI002151F31E|nr:molybdenum cofactor biosynthesis protein MoaE [Aquincola sp. J276]MCR5864860.1 molybdenum cofactor biosynthesis protein MoaE [Aquincola sp. J276]